MHFYGFSVCASPLALDGIKHRFIVFCGAVLRPNITNLDNQGTILNSARRKTRVYFSEFGKYSGLNKNQLNLLDTSLREKKRSKWEISVLVDGKHRDADIFATLTNDRRGMRPSHPTVNLPHNFLDNFRFCRKTAD